MKWRHCNAPGVVAFALALLCCVAAHAQPTDGQPTAQITSTEFAQAPSPQKIAYLRALFDHKFPIDTGQLVETIRVGLGDADARIRRMALTTVTGRSLGPIFGKGKGMDEWIRERPAILQLRPVITRALTDGDGDVRGGAVAALQAIDFDGVQPFGRKLSPETVSALADRYGKETFVEARRAIIQVLGGGAASSPVAQKTVRAAMTTDAEPQLRDLARRLLADSGPASPK